MKSHGLLTLDDLIRAFQYPNKICVSCFNISIISVFVISVALSSVIQKLNCVPIIILMRSNWAVSHVDAHAPSTVNSTPYPLDAIYNTS